MEQIQQTRKNAMTCSHAMMYKRQPLRDGRWYIVKQCSECGMLESKAISKLRCPFNPETLVMVNEKEAAAARQDVRDHHEQIHQQEKARKKAEWFKQHDEYLRSDAWRAKRKLALMRDKGICQGCLMNTATDVHHLMELVSYFQTFPVVSILMFSWD